MTDIADDIVGAIERVIGPAATPVPLHEPEEDSSPITPQQAHKSLDKITKWITDAGHADDHVEQVHAAASALRR